jgi:hypothetical protein
MAIQYVTNHNPDGSLIGQSATDKIGFYGLTTPIVQPTITAVATVTATTTINEARIARIETALVNLGLITTAG